MLLQEQLTVIEAIPYRTFKEKIRITKGLKDFKQVEILKNLIIVERVRVN